MKFYCTAQYLPALPSPPLQVLRDRHDQAPCDRRLEAAGGHAQRGAADLRVQARVPVHLRLGDQGPAPLRRDLLQRQRAQREYSLMCTTAVCPTNTQPKISVPRNRRQPYLSDSGRAGNSIRFLASNNLLSQAKKKNHLCSI